MRIDNLTCHVSDELSSPATELIGEGLEMANQDAAPMQNVRPIVCFVRSASGKVIDGARGRTWGQCAELQQLWADGPHHRRGVGSKLVRLFETRAIERGCRMFYLQTFSFQSPRLYRGPGYTVAADNSGFPDDIHCLLMTKTR